MGLVAPAQTVARRLSWAPRRLGRLRALDRELSAALERLEAALAATDGR